MDNKTLKEFMREHQCMVEDLRVAANLIPQKRSILVNSLRKYADELAQYDINYCKEYTDPFK